MPRFTTPTLIKFKRNERYKLCRSGDGEITNFLKGEFERILEIEKLSKDGKRKLKEFKVYNQSQMRNYESDTIFTTDQVKKILELDKTSPFKGQKISIEKIRKMITTGELIGYKKERK